MRGGPSLWESVSNNNRDADCLASISNASLNGEKVEAELVPPEVIKACDINLKSVAKAARHISGLTVDKNESSAWVTFPTHAEDASHRDEMSAKVLPNVFLGGSISALAITSVGVSLLLDERKRYDDGRRVEWDYPTI